MKSVYSLKTNEKVTLFSNQTKLVKHLKRLLISNDIEFNNEKFQNHFNDLKTIGVKQRYINYIFDDNHYQTTFGGADKLVTNCHCEEIPVL